MIPPEGAAGAEPSEAAKALAALRAIPLPAAIARRPWVWLAAALAFVVVVASRMAFVAEYGVDVPFLDEWNAEGTKLYAAYAHGELGVGAFFAPHNEHRILFTRLLNFAVFLANGRWSPRAVMFVQALLPAVIAALFVFWSARGRTRPIPSSALLLTGLFALPLAAMNLLWAFQNAFFFVTLFSVAALRLATSDEDVSWLRYAAVVLLCVCAYFSLASGVVTAVVAGGCFLYSARLGTHARRDLLRSAGLFLLVGLMFLLVPRVAKHDNLVASSVTDVLRGLWMLVTWPVGTGALVWLPALVVLARLRHGGLATVRPCVFPLALYAWTLAQIALLCAGRSPFLQHLYTNKFLVGRYVDLLLPGVAAFAFLLDAEETQAPAAPRLVGPALLKVAVLLSLVAAVQQFSAPQAEELRAVRSDMLDRIAFVARFSEQAGDPSIQSERLRVIGFSDDPEELLRLLDDRELRPYLPEGIARSKR